MNITTRHIRRGWHFILSGLFLLSGACSGSDDDRHRFRIYHEGGVEVARTTGGPRFTESLFTFEPVQTLNQDPSREESLLYRPTSFVMGPDGYFYVEDSRNHRIAVFNPEGEYERAFGRKGSGPGEFDDLWGIVGFDGSVLTILDIYQRRITRYRTDGELLETITPIKGGMFDTVYHIPGDRLVVIDSEGELRDGFRYSRSVAFITDSTMEDTLAAVRSDWVMIAREMFNDDGTRGIPRPLTFFTSPTSLYAAGRGILITSGIEPVIDWYDLEGKLTHRIVVDLPLKPVTVSMRTAYITAYNRRLTDRENPRPPRPRDWFVFPEFIGYWRGARVDDAGYTWLRDVQDASEFEHENGYLFHLLDPRGRYLGTTRLPSDLGWNISRGNLLDIAVDNQTGERTPTVYRIVPVVRGLRYP